MTDDRTYFYHRAEQEIEMAQRAEKPEAVRAHFMLANRYLEAIEPNARSVMDAPERD